MAQATGKLFERAKQAFEKKNYEYAVNLFRKIVDMEPGNQEARQLLRQSEMREKSKGGYPNSFIAKLSGIVPLMKMKFAKSPEKIVRLCEDYLESDPNNLKVRIRLAKNLEELGYPEVGIKELKPLTNHYDESPELHKNLAVLYIADNRSTKAQPHLKKLRRLKPSDREVDEMLKNAMAESTVEEGGWEDAESTQELIRDDQDEEQEQTITPDRTLTDPDEIREAISQLKKEVKRESDDDARADKLDQVGKYYKKLDQYNKAATAYEKALEHRPNDGTLKEKVGNMKIRRWKHRLENVEDQISNNPDNKKLKKKRQKLNQKLLKEQISEYKRRVKEHPTDMELRFELGKYLLNADQLGQAIEQLQKAVRDPKVQTQAHNLLGKGFLKKNHLDMAVSEFEKGLDAARTSERSQELKYNLARAYIEEGKWEEARKALREILEVDYAYRDASELLDQVKEKL